MAADGLLRAADGWEVHRGADGSTGRHLVAADKLPATLPRVRLALEAAVRSGDRAEAGRLAPLAGAVVVEPARWERWSRRLRRPAFLRWIHRAVRWVRS